MIKSFLKKALLFISIPATIIVFIFVVFSLLHRSLTNEYKLDDGVHEIFAGDSHIQAAINDSLMEGCMNLGQSAEAFYFSYFKLKAILASNPQINKVYLGFSYHNLSDYYEIYIRGNESQFVSSRYFFILPFSEQLKLIVWNIKDFPSYFKYVLKSGIHNVTNKKDLTFSGGYYNEFKKALAARTSMDKRLKLQFYTDGKLNDFSDINLCYFNRIIELCHARNIGLILFNTPLHAYYRSKIPVAYRNKYHDIIRANNLKVIDFSALSLDDDCYIPDGDHLSEKGARLITQKLKEQKNTNTLQAYHIKTYTDDISLFTKYTSVRK
jgi:hypothetical protein